MKLLFFYLILDFNYLFPTELENFNLIRILLVRNSNVRLILLIR